MWPVSTSFLTALQSPVHTVRIKAEVLDTAFNPVAGGTFHDSNAPFIQNFITDGSVSLDTTRNTWRTMQLTLLNDGGDFSPNSAWTGLFYVNRLIRLWRGIDFGGGNVEYVPIGTFMIDEADVVVQQNMSLVVLSGSDLYKKMAKSQFTAPTSYPKGTLYNTIIRDFATASGVTKVSLDPITSRTLDATKLSSAVSYTTGAYRGDELAKLLTAAGIEAYMDPLGTLVSRDFADPTDFPTVLTLQGGPGGLLLTVDGKFTDDNLYNHALVVATGNPNTVFTAQKSDTDPRSPTNINLIGDRVFRYESSLIGTQAEANAAVTKVFYNNILLNEEIDCDMICHPGIDGSDIVLIVEPKFSALNIKVRVQKFTIPLASTRMQIVLQRVIKLT